METFINAIAWLNTGAHSLIVATLMLSSITMLAGINLLVRNK